MAKYLYNGVELPALPEFPTSLNSKPLSYAAIEKNSNDGSYLLHFAGNPIIYDGEQVVVNIPRAYGYVVNDEWVTDLALGGYVTMDSCIWSNHDILNADGSVYLAASDPVPVDGVEWKKHDAYKPNTKWDGNTFYRVMGGKWVKQDEVSPSLNEVEPDVPEPEKPTNCLTFSSAEPFTIGVNNKTKNWDGALYYSTDAETWSEWDGVTAISSAEHNGEQRIYMRGIGNSVITGELFENEWVLTGSSVRCEGNIENLLDYETVANGEHPTMGDRCFTKLFFNWTALITAPELPATTLEYFCYSNMFSGCTSLVTAPELPATTLADYCYSNMFSGCTSLVTAPKLPATTLAAYCYFNMFYGCAALTKAPELPATNLAEHCYASMFTRCSALTKAPELPATTLANDCYNRMFHSCTSLVTVPELPATILAEGCYDYMFENCTALATLPELYATSLPSACYRLMFSGCTNIKLSATQTGAYQTPYRIPMIGTGAITGNVVLHDMFRNTGGTFTGTPEINTTYYTSNTVV